MRQDALAELDDQAIARFVEGIIERGEEGVVRGPLEHRHEERVHQGMIARRADGKIGSIVADRRRGRVQSHRAIAGESRWGTTFARGAGCARGCREWRRR